MKSGLYKFSQVIFIYHSWLPVCLRVALAWNCILEVLGQEKIQRKHISKTQRATAGFSPQPRRSEVVTLPLRHHATVCPFFVEIPILGMLLRCQCEAYFWYPTRQKVLSRIIHLPSTYRAQCQRGTWSLSQASQGISLG